MSRLSIYNGALRLLGERKLSSLTENREPRRIMDDAWDDGLVRYCLEQGLWNFAMRSSKFDYDPSQSPDFGHQYVFQKPDDWVRTASVCSDEYFTNPVTQYEDERGFWYSSLQTIYVKYVSDSTEYGLDYSLWPETFANYVDHEMADEVCMRITQNRSLADQIGKDCKKARIDARSKDAMNEPAKFPPKGSWSRSRTGSRGLFYDPTEQQ
jgi:hypothetical protein